MAEPATPLKRQHLPGPEASPSPYRRRAAPLTSSDAETGSLSTQSSLKHQHSVTVGREGPQQHDKAASCPGPEDAVPSWELGDYLGAFLQLGLLTLFVWEIALNGALLAGLTSKAFKGFLSQREQEAGEIWDAREVNFLGWYLTVLILTALWQLWVHAKRLLYALVPGKAVVVPEPVVPEHVVAAHTSDNRRQQPQDSSGYRLDTVLTMHMVINEWPKIAVFLCLVNRLQGMQAWCSMDWEKFSRHFFSEVFSTDAVNALALATHASSNNFIANHPPDSLPSIIHGMFSSCVNVHVLDMIKGSLFLSCINCIGTLIRLFTKESRSAKQFLAACITGSLGTAFILYRPLTSAVVVGEVQAIFTTMALLESSKYSRLAVASLFFGLLTTAFLLLAAHCRALHIKPQALEREMRDLQKQALGKGEQLAAYEKQRQGHGDAEDGTLGRRGAWRSPASSPVLLNISPDTVQSKAMSSLPRSDGSMVKASMVRKGLKFDDEGVDLPGGVPSLTDPAATGSSSLTAPLGQSTSRAAASPQHSPTKAGSTSRSWLTTAREMGATVLAAVTGSQDSMTSTTRSPRPKRSNFSQSIGRSPSKREQPEDVGHTTTTIAVDGISMTSKSRLADVRTHSIARFEPAAGLPADLHEASTSRGVVAHKPHPAVLSKEQYMQAMGSFVHHKNALLDGLESQDDYLELGRPNDGPMPDYTEARDLYEDSEAGDDYGLRPADHMRACMTKVGFMALLVLSAIGHILSATLVGTLKEELNYSSGWLANDVAISAVQMVVLLVMTLCVISVRCGATEA